MTPQLAVRLVRITVGAGRMRAEVQLAPGAPRRTTPALMKRVLQRFPHLPHHACVNPAGGSFSDVMNDTPMPHLVEHIVIDLQTQAAQSDEALFVGTTEWLDEAAGTACIQVSFTDDLVALRSFREAVDVVNGCSVLP